MSKTFILDQLNIKRQTYLRALQKDNLSEGQWIELRTKLDAVVAEIEALTECSTCHHIGRYCTCPF